MKILFIGDFNIVLLPNLITELSKTSENEYSIFSILSGCIYSSDEINNYANTRFPSNKIKRRIYFMLNIVKSTWKLIFMNSVDIINIHYINFYYFFFVPLFKWKSSYILLNLYGSDFYLLSKKKLFLQKYVLNSSNKILFSNPQMAKDFIKEHPKFSEKVFLYRMGLPILNGIDKLKNDKILAKEIIHLPTDKIAVFCGHSAHVRERHVEMIKQLKKLPDSYKELIFIVFPFTYNCTPEFIRNITDEMLDSGITYQIITKFLSEDEVAALRVSCDILISLPSSDQMTAAMLETLYAGGIVITGTWLPYDFLDKNEISYLKIIKIDQLPEMVIKVIKSLLNGQTVIQQNTNRKVIEKYFSWKYCRSEWLNLFSTLQSKSPPY